MQARVPSSVLAAWAESVAEQRTDLAVQQAMTRERAKNAYVKYGTAGHYFGDEEISHWIGFGIDLVNPIADVQDISDLLEDLSGYDWGDDEAAYATGTCP